MDETELLVQRQIDWLQDASPDDWHRLAYDYNWNEELDPLFWMVCQPQCDKATALLIFWKGEPTGYDYETDDAKMGDDSFAVAPMLRYIAERFNTEGYTRSEIAYDFLDTTGHDADSEYAPMLEAGRLRDFEDLVERQKHLGDPHVKIHPDMMLLNIAGRKVGGYGESDFHDRFPQDIDRFGVEQTAQVDDEPSGIHEPTANAPAQEELNNDASSRVRAIRQQAVLDGDGLSNSGNNSTFLAWFKRLFGR